MENKSNDSGWPHFQDEDYIVFCFKEDGAFDVVKDGKLEALELFDSGNRSPRPVVRKLNYGEVAETCEKSSHGKTSNAQGIGQGLNPVEEDEEEQNTYLDIESHSVASARGHKFEVMEKHGIRKQSVESSDSNQSESSTGSFSFPILHWELMGSPAQMPKSEGLYIRKHKLTCALFSVGDSNLKISVNFCYFLGEWLV
ncbi:hypothetical protein GH714_040958 [Hevea brasiliensis]|uniref:Uncharacterized protein n=1 Tax=Hevea brasiliensis TaxID=3981 RepID=A0A6A6MLL3_HEVBR|nr:hypothetical protein GH714_040958 [Hevea brasiliensis]